MANISTVDLSIKQGSTFQADFVWLQADGNPQDLTGFTGACKFRQDYTSASALLSLTSPLSGITITPLTGTVTVHITEAQSAAIAEGNWVYDIELDSGNGALIPLVGGRAVFFPEVTK